jgi:hypothetical protein
LEEYSLSPKQKSASSVHQGRGDGEEQESGPVSRLWRSFPDDKKAQSFNCALLNYKKPGKLYLLRYHSSLIGRIY